MGIDETTIDGKLRLVITDLGARKPIDLQASRCRLTLADWLLRFKDRSMESVRIRRQERQEATVRRTGSTLVITDIACTLCSSSKREDEVSRMA